MQITLTTLRRKICTAIAIWSCALNLAALGQSWPTIVTSGGRFLRGSGTNEDYMSVVIPLSGQRGIAMPRMDFELTGPNLFPYNTTNFPITYHYNATNGAPQTNKTGRIPFQFQVAAFGSRAGGSPLYYYQPYSFGIYAGSPYNFTNALVVDVINKATYAYVDTIRIPIPDISSSTAWGTFLTNGYTTNV